MKKSECRRQCAAHPDQSEKRRHERETRIAGAAQRAADRHIDAQQRQHSTHDVNEFRGAKHGDFIRSEEESRERRRVEHREEADDGHCRNRHAAGSPSAALSALHIARSQVLANQRGAGDRKSAADHHGRVQHVDADVVCGECLGAVVVADQRHEQKEAKLQHELLECDGIADMQQALVACLLEEIAGIKFDRQFLAHPEGHQHGAAQQKGQPRRERCTGRAHARRTEFAQDEGIEQRQIHQVHRQTKQQGGPGIAGGAQRAR